jgi:hypothetical protein
MDGKCVGYWQSEWKCSEIMLTHWKVREVWKVWKVKQIRKGWKERWKVW